MPWYWIEMEEIEDELISPEILSAIRIRHHDFNRRRYLCYFDEGYASAELAVRQIVPDDELREYGIYEIYLDGG